MLQKYNIYLKDRLGKVFLAEKSFWKSGNFWLSDTEFFIAGWATSNDIKRWQQIRSGSKIFPYFKTRNENYGCEINNLRKLSTLGDYLKNI